ncbi:uncharacterized protein LOC144196785 [Stigmatopora nigra]
MADSKVEGNAEISAKELKEKKTVEAEKSPDDATANGKKDQENGERDNRVAREQVNDDRDVGDEDDGDGEEEEEEEELEEEEEEDEDDEPAGKRTLGHDDEDKQEPASRKKQKTDK